MSEESYYWETKTVSWPCTVDEDGNIIKTGPERIENWEDSGLNLTGEEWERLSDDWQVAN